MAYLAKKAKEEQAQKAAGSVEKYHHKGAFFMVSYPLTDNGVTGEADHSSIGRGSKMLTVLILVLFCFVLRQ